MDIKPDNILYDSQGRIKVCDFGLSEFSGKVLTRPVGSPLFMSPEMLQADKRKPATITEKTDVYSFGILLWEILTKKKSIFAPQYARKFSSFSTSDSNWRTTANSKRL